MSVSRLKGTTTPIDQLICELTEHRNLVAFHRYVMGKLHPDLVDAPHEVIDAYLEKMDLGTGRLH